MHLYKFNFPFSFLNKYAYALSPGNYYYLMVVCIVITKKIFLGRINMSQANSLNLFSNKEQECEQRAQLLKRLAFVLLCSEKDQFHKHVPEIQGFSF